MNAQFSGRFDVAPRSHPNDGRCDIVTLLPALGFRQRWQAKRRLPLGTHVPHPEIPTSSVRSWSLEVRGRVPVRVDGRRYEATTNVSVSVRPDAFVACV
jgi:diacylglycerol kinase family enzyme